MAKSFVSFLLILLSISLYAENKCYNSSSNYIVIDSRQFTPPSSQITVECWIKPNSLENWSAPVSFITDDYHIESGFAMAFVGDKVRLMLKTSEMRGDEWNYNPGVDVNINQWVHIASTYDGESIKIYKNGELVEIKLISGSIDWLHSPLNLHIGAFKDRNEEIGFDGHIDEVRIWNVARSIEEINQFKNQKLLGREKGLIAYYNFDNDENTLIKDNSNSNLNGKNVLPIRDQIIIPSGAFVVPHITKFEILSPSSFQLEWETSESVYTYDYYLVEISKDRTFKQLLSSRRSTDRSLILDNIYGSSKIFFRIKAFSKDIGYTAYSEVKEITNFSTALSVIVKSMDNGPNSQHKLVDYNILMNDLVIFPSTTKDIQFSFNLNNQIPENITNGEIIIKGPSRTYESDFSRSSNLSLFDLKPGKYDILVRWGNIENKAPLEINLKMEIKPIFIHTVSAKVLLLIVVLISLYFLIKNFHLLSDKKFKELKEQIPTKESLADWIDPAELEKKALLIKEFILAEKLFLDPKFNLKLLAEKTDIPHYQISKILKEYYELNFNDFINEFRVNEYIAISKENNKKHIKKSAIAYQCGFYSESTFFRAFKKFIGKTPQQFQKELTELEK